MFADEPDIPVVAVFAPAPAAVAEALTLAAAEALSVVNAEFAEPALSTAALLPLASTDMAAPESAAAFPPVTVVPTTPEEAVVAGPPVAATDELMPAPAETPVSVADTAEFEPVAALALSAPDAVADIEPLAAPDVAPDTSAVVPELAAAVPPLPVVFDVESAPLVAVAPPVPVDADELPLAETLAVPLGAVAVAPAVAPPEAVFACARMIGSAANDALTNAMANALTLDNSAIRFPVLNITFSFRSYSEVVFRYLRIAGRGHYLPCHAAVRGKRFPVLKTQTV